MNSFDANKMAEAIFRSILSVLYGFPATFVRVLQQPAQGPLAIMRNSRRQHSLYLRPHVFVFISSIIISSYFHMQYVIWGWVLGMEPFDFSNFIRPRISPTEFALFYIITLVIYDAYGRVLWAISRRPGRREFYQESFYVFGAQALVLIIGSLVLTPIWFHSMRPIEVDGFVGEAFVSIPVYITWIYSLYLPMPWFSLILTKVIKARWALNVASFGVSLFVLSTVSLGLHAAGFLVGYAQPRAAYVIDTSACRHYLRDNLVEIIVAVKNSSNEPLLLSSKDVEVTLLKGDPAERIEFSASEWVVPRSFIEPDETGWILVDLSLGRGVTGDFVCRIHVRNPLIHNRFFVRDVVEG